MEKSKQKNFLFVITFIISSLLVAQSGKKDSLCAILKSSAHDTVKVNTLLALGSIFKNTVYDSTIAYCEKALSLSNQLSFRGGQVKSYTMLANTYWKKGEFPASLDNNKKALLVRAPEDKRGQAINYDNIGNIYRAQGDYAKALEHFLKAVRLRESSGRHKELAYTYSNIGVVYKNTGKLQEAIDYHFKSLKIAEGFNDPRGIGTASSNLGLTLWVKRDYRSALDQLFRAAKIWEEKNDLQNLSAAYNNIGLVYFDQDNFSSALTYHFKAHEINKLNKDIFALSVSNNNIGNDLEKLGNYDEAIKYQQHALEGAIETSSLENMKYAYDGLASAYNSRAQKTKNFSDLENSLKYYKLYMLMQDSIMNEQNAAEFAKMAVKYETEKKEARIALLNKDKALKEALLERVRAQKATQRNIFIGVTLFLLLFTVFVFYFIRSRRRTEKVKLAKQLSELEHQALRLQMNPHFIFNSLNAISNYIGKSETAAAKKFLAKFAKLMRLILENSRETYVSLQNEIDTLSYYLELEQLRFVNKFEFSIQVDPNINSAEIEIPPMLLQPLIENAVLHGVVPSDKSGNIDIQFSMYNGSLQCLITDNGIGREKARERKDAMGLKHKSMAMNVTQERLTMLGKKKNFAESIVITDLFDDQQNSAGTRVTIDIPFKTN